MEPTNPNIKPPIRGPEHITNVKYTQKVLKSLTLAGIVDSEIPGCLIHRNKNSPTFVIQFPESDEFGLFVTIVSNADKSGIIKTSVWSFMKGSVIMLKELGYITDHRYSNITDFLNEANVYNDNLYLLNRD
jgi:hypothetical protein